jgi:outer membrane protein TolC
MRRRHALLSLAVFFGVGVHTPAASASNEGPARVEIPPLTATGEDVVVRSVRLAEIVVLAFENNLDLALAATATRRAAAVAREEEATLVPTLELGASYRTRDGRIQGSFGRLADGDFDTYQGWIGLSYKVNIGAKIHDAIAARSRGLQAVLSELDTEQRVILQVAELFADLELARTAVGVATQLAAESDSFVRITAARERAGLGSGADTARARAKLAADRREELDARQLWVEVSAGLATVLRLDPMILLEPAEGRILAWHLGPAPEAIERPDVESYRQAVDAAGHSRSAARWNLFAPELIAGAARIELGEAAGELAPRTDYGAALRWQLSLNKIAAIHRHEADAETAKLELQRIEDRVARETAVADRNVDLARQRIPIAEDGVTAAERNLRISNARFTGGTAIALEVFDAQNTLAHAWLNLAEAIVSSNLAQLRLLATTGHLGRENLPLPLR